VSDPDCAPITRQADAPGNDDIVLNPGETWVFTCSEIFASPGTFNNTATASGTTSVTAGSRVVTNPPDTDETASAQVIILASNTTLTKTADKDVYKPGETIHYNVTETNTGDIAIDNVVVTDSNAGVLGAPDSGDTGNDGVLSPGETWVWNYDRLVTEEDCDTSIHNTVNATGTLVGTNIPAPLENAEEDVSVQCEVGTTLTKTADKSTVNIGDTITYTITETNTGTVAITSVVVTDSYMGALGDPQSGDAVNPGVLDPGETWTWTYSRTVTETDPCLIHNEVTATGTIQGTNTPAPLEHAQADVRVICIVGGEILGVDATALLIAGAGANVFTILPILGGIAGAIYFAARRWKNNN
jgi:hypothetical protein